MHFKVAACGRLLQTQAAMHISFKLDEQANHSAGELLKIVNQKTGLHQEYFPIHGGYFEETFISPELFQA